MYLQCRVGSIVRENYPKLSNSGPTLPIVYYIVYKNLREYVGCSSNETPGF